MKKILILIICSLPLTSLIASINVLTCEPEWMALALEIGGDKLSVKSATTGLQDPHRIEARPSLLAKARNADLLICTGADLEIGWLPLLIRKSANRKIQRSEDGYFMATDYALLLEKPDSLDRSEGDIHAPGNPHIQMDPRRLLDVAEALSDRLQLIDSDNAMSYQQNYDDFKLRWIEAIRKWEEKAVYLKGLNIITYHRSWIYLQEWLGLNLTGTIEPKPGVPPSTGYLSKLVRKAKDENVSVIIHAAYTSDKSSRWLTQRTNVPMISLPYTVGGSKQATNLFTLFDETIDLLIGAAGGH